VETLAAEAYDDGCKMARMPKWAIPFLLVFAVMAAVTSHAQTAEQAAISRSAALVRAARPKQAENVLREALKANPNSESLHGELGRLLFKRARYEDAVEQLGMAVQINSNSRVYSMLLAEALLGWQHFGVAVDFLQAVRDKFGSFPEFHYDLGLAYYSENKLKEAKPEFEEAVRIAPDLDKAHFLLAACVASEGDYAHSVEIFRTLVKTHPENATYWITLAQMLNHLGSENLPEALRACKRARALKPHDPHIQYVSATVLMQSGDFAGARPLFEHLVSLNPKELEAHVALARIYGRLGEPELAKKETHIVEQIEKEKSAESAAGNPNVPTDAQQPQ